MKFIGTIQERHFRGTFEDTRKALKRDGINYEKLRDTLVYLMDTDKGKRIYEDENGFYNVESASARDERLKK